MKYDLLRADVRNGFDTAGTCVEADGFDTTATDPSATAIIWDVNGKSRYEWTILESSLVVP